MRAPRNLRRTWLAVAAALACAAPLGALAQDALPTVPLESARRSDLPPPDMEPFLGIVIDPFTTGARVRSVVPGSPAESAGVASGDVLVRIGALGISGAASVDGALRAAGIGSRVRLRLEHRGDPREVTATIAARRRPDGCFRGSRFELLVVPLRFAGEHDAPSAATLERLLFSAGDARAASASVADYYRAQSGGRIELVGRVLAPITLPLPRTRYATQPMGGAPGSAFEVAANLLEERDGAALGSADGIAFVYAGEAEARPGFALWPHRASVVAGKRRLPYYVHCQDEDAPAIGVHCHEFGHLLGLPDRYGAGHVTGSGDFCLMAIGHRGGLREGARRPFSLCAWCRMRLGWAEPVMLDPRTPQRVRIEPLARDASRVAVVPLSPRTDEYLLLEVRSREGFDAELPSAGLLVWHVGGAATPGQGRYGAYVDLVEAHGIDCVDASLVRTGEIAFPTPRARDLTPDTVPALRTAVDESFAAHLTDIAALPGGGVAVTLGVARSVAQRRPDPHAEPPCDAEGFAVRRDPVTGGEVRLYVGSPSEGPVPEPSQAEQSGERR